MKKSFLFIVDSYPFPINNGVTAAIGSFSNILEYIGDVNYYCIRDESIVYLDKRHEKIKFLEIDFSKYEIIITSPLKPSLTSLKMTLNKNKRWALLSDCYTYALFTNIRLYIKFKNHYSKIPITTLKMIYYYFVEFIIARKFKYVLMQTPKDSSVFKYLFFKKNVISFPNMPNLSNNSNTSIKRDYHKISFVASFQGSYLMIAKWFIEEVWTEVIKIEPNARLHLVGNNKAEFRDIFDPNIKRTLIVEKYYEDLKDFYVDTNIAVTPIFKGYGLINKTVEAMQHGCIVIGDKAAFNGIEYAENKINCMIAETAQEFTELILYYIKHENEDMRKKAKEAIVNSFDKSKYINLLDIIIEKNN